MANQEVVNNFNNLYDQMYAKFRPSYTPQSASTLKDTLSRAMRGSYDKEIQNVKKSTARTNAAIDADSTTRGMGSSTYNTDVKNRNMNEEANRIYGIESDYNAALYSALLNRLNAQDELSLTAENQARGNALGAANALFGLYNSSTGGGGGWGRRGRGSVTPTDTQGQYQEALDALKKQGYTTRSAVDYLQKGTNPQKVQKSQPKKTGGGSNINYLTSR